MSKPEDRVNQRGRICEAALELISSEGYKGASVQKIMDRVGIHKTTFFHYYKNKEELLEELLSGPLSQATEILRGIKNNVSLAPEEKLKLAIQNHLEWILQNQAVASIYQNELRSLPLESLAQYLEERKLFAGYFTEVVAEMQSAKDMMYFSGLDTKLVTYGILGMCNWAVKWFSAEGKYSPKEIADTFYSMLVQPRGGSLLAFGAGENSSWGVVSDED